MSLLKMWEKIEQTKRVVYGPILGFLIGFFQWNIFNYIGLYIGESPNSFSLIFSYGSFFGLIYALILLVSALLYLKNKETSKLLIKVGIVIFWVISILMILFLLWNIKPIRDI